MPNIWGAIEVVRWGGACSPTPPCSGLRMAPETAQSVRTIGSILDDRKVAVGDVVAGEYVGHFDVSVVGS